MPAEKGIGKTDLLRLTLEKSCPHCGKKTVHDRDLVIPLSQNSAYKIKCPSCREEILVNWIPDPHDGMAIANFSKPSTTIRQQEV